jgi:hypothetical protein
MDQINNAATIFFIVTMLWVAAGHSSLAHRKVYSQRGWDSPVLTLVLGLYGLASALVIAAQNPDGNGDQKSFDRGNAAHLAASTAHVGSWCLGVVSGGDDTQLTRI